MASKPSFFIGLHNIVTDKKEWKQLLFYDIDKDEHFSNTVKKFASEFSNRRKLSYVLYKTKHGFHSIYLTPLAPGKWGEYFELHKKKFQGYYSGHTIRMSRKKKEEQYLISHSDAYPAVYPLCTIYEKRFNITFKNIIKMAAVYENYPSRNL